jgi:hypothetical protein
MIVEVQAQEAEEHRDRGCIEEPPPLVQMYEPMCVLETSLELTDSPF